ERRGGAAPDDADRGVEFPAARVFLQRFEDGDPHGGTPQAMLTRSLTIRPRTLSGSTLGPGRTRRAPSMVHAKGRPQALAWNMGATGSTVSKWLMPKTSPRPHAKECSTSAR